MSTSHPAWDPHAAFADGLAIPAVPLALRSDRTFDEESQRALIRYYVDAGSGGVAVGVHSTQFAIRDIPGFYDELLGFVSRTIDDWSRRSDRRLVKIAGICGDRQQALSEAVVARSHGYHAGLVSLTALGAAPLDELLDHVASIAVRIPVVGFYLQPAVGGRILPYEFWRRLAMIENVWGVKIAPFNRYATLGVLRGIADSGRAGQIALYTGNDDTIVTDLTTRFEVGAEHGPAEMRIVGGLLGHWGVWTSRAVELFHRCRALADSGEPIPLDVLTTAGRVTDMNGAVFDAAHGYAGCLPGIHEVLRRQGLFRSIVCLDPEETLGPGQEDEITRVCRSYPQLTDDAFVREHIDLWRS